MSEPEDETPQNQKDLPLVAYVCAVWNLIIRPPRARYTRNELMKNYPCGRFNVFRQPVVRSNFFLTNARGFKLACTLFEPYIEEGAGDPQRACVVYCHGNASSRIAGFRLVPALLPMNIALLCFDFSGSGMSGGEYVSLGFHERDDLCCAIEYLRNSKGFQRIGLWGHSMGAVTVLLHASRDPSLAGVVADSPFSDLWGLIEEICYSAVRVPSVMLSPLLNLVRWVIQKKADFDIRDVSPRAAMSTCFIPALFLHGEEDDFITPKHSKELFQSYNGEKLRLVMPGADHNSRRQEKFDIRAVVFLIRAFRWEQHLPEGIEAKLVSLMERSRTGESGELPSIPDSTSQMIKALLTSGLRDKVSEGLVRAASELCVAYHGASSVVPATRNSVACPQARKVQSPARFSGYLTFAGDQDEIAICWTQEGPLPAAHAGGRVFFAVISPTAVSLTEVLLGTGGQKAASGSSGRGARAVMAATGAPPGGHAALSCAGLTCQAVEPLAFEAPDDALAAAHQHPVVLTISEATIELSVGAVNVSSARSCRGELHLWCMRWEQNGDSSSMLELEEETWKLGDKSGVSHRAGGSPLPDVQKRQRQRASCESVEGLATQGLATLQHEPDFDCSLRGDLAHVTSELARRRSSMIIL